MAPLAHLLLAACTLAGSLHAASVSLPASEKKIPALIPEDAKEPTDAGHELADLHEPVKEIENELRVKPAVDIPVAVVIEPSVKNNEIDDDDTKRPQVDLRNPGPPQRQEHETQNPEQHPDELLKASTIKENIEQAQNVLRQKYQDVTDVLQNWVSNNEDQTKVQQNIQNLRDTFGNQIQKLNVTIQALAKPEESKPADAQGEASEKYFEKIESRLKVLEDNFNNGVDTLSAGINIVASLKSASEEGNEARQEGAPADTSPSSSASPTNPTNSETSTAPPSSTTYPPNLFQQAANSVSAIWSNNVSQMQQIFQSIFNSTSTTPQPAVLSDQLDGTTASPQLLPSWLPQLPAFSNWTNFNPISTLNFTGLNRPPPFSNWTNFNPILSFFNRTRPGQQAAAAPPVVSNPETSDKPVEPQSDQPAGAPAEAAAAAVSPPVLQPEGPIRQFLSPVVNRINGVVQQLQNNFANNPEKGRDPVEKNDSLSAKGGWYGPPGRPGGSGDNNNSGLNEQRAEEIKEPVQEEPKKEAEDIKEVKPEMVSEKTE